MLIENAKCGMWRCPFVVGQNCLGPQCAVWRADTAAAGHCGAGGPVAASVVFGDRPEAVSGKKTTEAAVPLRRRR
jgi:hypothetical protein